MPANCYLAAKLIFKQAKRVKKVIGLENQQYRRCYFNIANTRAAGIDKIGKNSNIRAAGKIDKGNSLEN